MPQKAAKLPDATIEQIARWIDLGAPYDKPLVDRAGAIAAKDKVVTDEGPRLLVVPAAGERRRRRR